MTYLLLSDCICLATAAVRQEGRNRELEITMFSSGFTRQIHVEYVNDIVIRVGRSIVDPQTIGRIDIHSANALTNIHRFESVTHRGGVGEFACKRPSGRTRSFPNTVKTRIRAFHAIHRMIVGNRSELRRVSHKTCGRRTRCKRQSGNVGSSSVALPRKYPLNTVSGVILAT